MKEWALYFWSEVKQRWGLAYAPDYKTFNYSRPMHLQTLEDALEDLAMCSRHWPDKPHRIMNVNTYEVIYDSIF